MVRYMPRKKKKRANVTIKFVKMPEVLERKLKVLADIRGYRGTSPLIIRIMEEYLELPVIDFEIKEALISHDPEVAKQKEYDEEMKKYEEELRIKSTPTVPPNKIE